MTKRAMGESQPQSGLIKAAAITKMMALIKTKRSALEADISPAGISRSAVLGFRASKFLSRYLLNAMAALRAVTIQTRTRRNNLNTGTDPNPLSPVTRHSPSVNPMMAKGSAKTVWEKVIS